MDLANLIVPSKTITVEYPGFPNFEVKLAYLTRDELMKLRSRAVTTKFNKKTRAPEEELDADLFQELYIEAVIKGWSGLKFKYLKKMVPVDLSDIEDEEAELDFSTANADVLMKNATGFDTWITDVLDDVSNFT